MKVQFQIARQCCKIHSRKVLGLYNREMANKKQLFKYLLILDFEATCDDKQRPVPQVCMIFYHQQHAQNIVIVYQNFSVSVVCWMVMTHNVDLVWLFFNTTFFFWGIGKVSCTVLSFFFISNLHDLRDVVSFSIKRRFRKYYTIHKHSI